MNELLCDTCRARLQAVAVGSVDGLTATEMTAIELDAADKRDFKELLFDLIREQQEEPDVRSTAINVLSYRLFN